MAETNNDVFMLCPVIVRDDITLMDGILDLRPRIGSKIHHHSYDGGIRPFFKYLVGLPYGLVPNGASPEVGLAFPLQYVIPVVKRIFLSSPS